MALLFGPGIAVSMCGAVSFKCDPPLDAPALRPPPVAGTAGASDYRSPWSALDSGEARPSRGRAQTVYNGRPNPGNELVSGQKAAASCDGLLAYENSVSAVPLRTSTGSPLRSMRSVKVSSYV